MNEQIEIIRQACIKANPEIKELKFGCEVYCEQVLEDETGNYVDMYGIFIHNTNRDEAEVLLDDVASDDLKDGFHTMIVPYEPKNMEVIGRTIRLNDVLLAIYKINPHSLMVAVNGTFYEWEHMDKLPVPKEVQWNIGQDDIRLQSPELIAFLAKVLSV